MTYLKNYEPDELVKVSRDTYSTREHDSLKISNGKWYWWSRGIGGYSALDFLIKVRDIPFEQAIEHLAGADVIIPIKSEKTKREEKTFMLPERNKTSNIAVAYLVRSRKIDNEIVQHCLDEGYIFEEKHHHNVVFVGFDDFRRPRYAAYRSCNSQRILRDCPGSSKEYSFRLLGTDENEVHVFESAIDALSFATILKRCRENYLKYNLLSLSGIYQPNNASNDNKIPVSLSKYLENNPKTDTVYLHLDSDPPGRNAAIAIKKALEKKISVIDEPPTLGKDVNDFLCIKEKLSSRTYEKGTR